MKNIFLVEDDPEISKLLSLHLHNNCYNLTIIDNGDDALEKICKEDFNIIILDIMLPGVNGLEICKIVRAKKNHTPIMMLTSLCGEADKITALDLGADDYITKPFSILELTARIKALLRRSEIDQEEKPKISFPIIYQDLHIDIEKKKACLRGERLDLSPKELDLLYLLASNPGKTFTREDILKLVWGSAYSGYVHTVTAHINRLRIKIEKDLQHPEYILTSWGTGYRFNE